MGNCSDPFYVRLDGESMSIEEFITRYDSKLYSFIYKIVGNRDAAMDITQDTLLKAVKYLHSYNSDKSFVTWIFTIAKNTTYDYLKKNTAANRNLSIDSENAEQISHNDNPEKVLQGKEGYLQLISLIDSLPEKYKLLIQMKYMLGLNYQEISQKLDIPTHKVESRLFMARQKLQKLIEKNSGREA